LSQYRCVPSAGKNGMADADTAPEAPWRQSIQSMSDHDGAAGSHRSTPARPKDRRPCRAYAPSLHAPGDMSVTALLSRHSGESIFSFDLHAVTPSSADPSA
jgi:hypothetical protein